MVQVGQSVDVWIKRVDPKKKRIDLTMIKPLDLEWREITKGMTVKGKVTRLEKFGAFVDIGAERPGLVHISEMTHGYVKTPGEVVKEGDEVEVQVLEVNRRKKQIKLSMKALEEKPDVGGQGSPASSRKKTSPKSRKARRKSPCPPPWRSPCAKPWTARASPKPLAARSKRKPSASSDELEDILERTLQHKVRTSTNPARDNQRPADTNLRDVLFNRSESNSPLRRKFAKVVEREF